jgi:ribosomal protein S18 acetylase RimI-like enzyme
MTREQVQFRRAQRQDLGAIIALIADDGLGMKRESHGEAAGPEYVEAFDAIASDANQLMAVAKLSGEVIGYMQISFIPGLSRRGAWRGQLESVRIASHLRGRGIGEQFFRWAIEQCRARNCRLVQLTTDKQRGDALRFYERLGFVPSHHGMKLEL